EERFEEDVPDLEGLRVAYHLMQRSYSDEALMEFEYEDIEITRAQAFFYAVGMYYCTALLEDHITSEHRHSPDNSRLNGMVSQMPEFSKAFGCQEGDQEYSDEGSTCHLFGHRAGMRMHEELKLRNEGETEKEEGIHEEASN
ncbi:hypothetical protein PMAYCL1PPCAC_19032, partial [Pristionchus mayeri]